MRAKKEINLLEGRILPTIVRLAMPIMASSFVGLAYTLTDMFWVAGLGDRAVAAVGSGGTLLWLIDNLFSIPRVGGQVLVGQSLGAGKVDEARMWTRAALRLGYTMAFVATLLFVFMSDTITSVYQFNDAETIIRTEMYIRIVSLGLIPKVGVRLYNAVFTASGNSFTPFVIYVTGLVINMMLDPLFILVFKWDVAGAAIATVIAETVAYVLMLVAIRRNEVFSNLRLFRERMQLQRLKPMLKLGAPISIQGSMHAVATILISRQIVRFGDLAVAAQRLGAQIESISWMTADGFSVAVNAFMAQNYGARSFDRVGKGYRVGFWLIASICTVASLIIYFLGGSFMAIFFSDPVAVTHGREYLQILSASQLLQGMTLLTSSAFSALGQSFIPSIIMTSFMLLRLPIGAMLSATSLGVKGIWWAFTITTNIAGLILIAIFPFFIRRLQNKEKGFCK
ncbi:MAG TPA: MATE family efflux transporter [Clostridiaceae bacterium]|nr:MATE family efflux transporter [Clostridiaceae bacterium]